MLLTFEENKRENCFRVFLNQGLRKERIASLSFESHEVIITSQFMDKVEKCGDSRTDVKRHIRTEFNRFLFKDITPDQMRMMEQSMNAIITLNNAFTEHIERLSFLNKSDRFNAVTKELRSATAPINKFAMDHVKSLSIDKVEMMCDLAEKLNEFLNEKLQKFIKM